MKDNLNNILIMASEPNSNITPTDVRNYFFERKTEKDLAEAFAIASNKFFGLKIMNMTMKKELQSIYLLALLRMSGKH